ncbi:hypothetical protein B0H21DRAFT_699382, partial [Amylocystis lapponica]
KVRFFVCYMMDRDSLESPIALASDKDADMFASKCHAGPSKADFRVHLTGSLRSAWNKRAAEVFAEAFLEDGWSECRDVAQIRRVFSVHLKTLRAQYRKALDEDDAAHGSETDVDRESRKQTALERQIDINRESRRRKLRSRRAGVVERHPDLARFKKLWESLPFEAMSGDESDRSGNSPRYVVTRLPWRSAEAEAWLRVHDLYHLSLKFRDNGKAKPGRFPHHRIRGSRRSEPNNEVVKKLPRNFYDQDFLSGLDDDQRAALDVQPEVDLKHTQAIIR